MVTLLKIQILSIIATALTNLVGILAFTTDHWSIVVYDLNKLHSHIKWILTENTTTNTTEMFNLTHDRNRTQIFSFNDQQLARIAIGIENGTILYKNHKGIFRQCNYLSENIRERLKLSKCRILKVTNNQYDDTIHGMNNPGRELIRKYFCFYFSPSSDRRLHLRCRPIIFAPENTEKKTTNSEIVDFVLVFE